MKITHNITEKDFFFHDKKRVLNILPATLQIFLEIFLTTRRDNPKQSNNKTNYQKDFAHFL